MAVGVHKAGQQRATAAVGATRMTVMSAQIGRGACREDFAVFKKKRVETL